MSSKKETKAILVALSKKFPATWGRMTKKRYILPQYRQADYYDQDDLNLQSLDYFITRYKRMHNPDDVVNNAGWALQCKSLQYDRPTFYWNVNYASYWYAPKYPPSWSFRTICRLTTCYGMFSESPVTV